MFSPIDLLAPISGTVLTKKAFKGQYIKTGEPLFEMGNLARLWFHAEVYERDLPDIRIGQKAILRTPTVPGRQFEGLVTFIDPNFNPQTRSTRIRIEVDNPRSDGEGQGLTHILPHRAYAEAEITAQLGESLVVPRSGVLRDGRRSVVYVEKSSVVYLEEALRKKQQEKGDAFQLQDLKSAVIEGAMLRFRAKGHDRRHSHCEPSPNYVEYANRRRSHEAVAHARHRWNGQQPRPCSDRYGCHLLLAETQGLEALAWRKFSAAT